MPLGVQFVFQRFTWCCSAKYLVKQQLVNSGWKRRDVDVIRLHVYDLHRRHLLLHFVFMGTSPCLPVALIETLRPSYGELGTWI